MSIRQATEADVIEVSTLVKSLAHFYLDEPENELPAWLSQTLTEKAFTERLSNGGYTNFVYEQNNKIIGYIALKKPNHLYHLFVLEQFQGKGISRLLWEYVKNSGQHASFTLRSSVYAVPIYKRFGFCESGQIGMKDGVSFQPMELNF
jgi:predicted N-acetyltransferase YhbS